MTRRSIGVVADLPGAPLAPMIDITFQILIFFIVTLKFPHFEGRLVSHLPMDTGPSYWRDRVVDEVRIVLCLDGDVALHVADRAAHDRRENWTRTDRVHIFVRRTPIFAVTDTDPLRHEAYREAAGQAKILLEALGPSARLKIDADSEVAFQHVIGILNALQAAGGWENLEYVANPRLTDLLGPGIR